MKQGCGCCVEREGDKERERELVGKVKFKVKARCGQQ